MTSRITQDPTKGEKGFPRLMIHDERGCIVLFSDPNHGTMLYDPSKDFAIGERDGWDFSSYRPFHGTVELWED